MKVNEVIKMTTWFDKLKNEIDDFFNNATDEEIQTALDKANYSYYINIDTPVLEMNGGCNSVIYKSFISVNLDHQFSSVNFLNQEFKFDKFSIADDNYYEYYAAA